MTVESLRSERATKKQRELLNFIDGFIKGNGYGPSYREVMRALDYKSVSTVATHVSGLISRGYLEKTDSSARSLRIIKHPSKTQSREQWLETELRKKRRSYALDTSTQGLQAVAAIDQVAKMFDLDV